MKLLDFFEEVYQRAENVFGSNAPARIDSLLYAKLPPKLKRSVNMARLKNARCDGIVTNLEREMELKGLVENDDILVPTLFTAPTATRLGNGPFPLVLTQGLLANTAKCRDIPMTIVETEKKREQQTQ